eukprot:11222184-Lingulodinium_polyedra.AAC.1
MVWDPGCPVPAGVWQFCEWGGGLLPKPEIPDHAEIAVAQQRCYFQEFRDFRDVRDVRDYRDLLANARACCVASRGRPRLRNLGILGFLEIIVS